MTRVDKPALLRRLFLLACEYSGQVLSYQKMLGQLQEAGNTITLAHYLDLLKGAGLVAGSAASSRDHGSTGAGSSSLQM
jgi:predicted AAA+ superfamily ATPase